MALFGLFLLMFGTMTENVFSQEVMVPENKGSLTIVYTKDNIPIDGAAFHIYQVASREKENRYEINAEFSDSGIELETGDGTAMYNCAAELEAYLVEQKNLNEQILPLSSGKTDENGRIAFENLEDGIYLITGEEIKIENEIYTPVASLVTVPGLDEDGSNDYRPIIKEKYQVRNSDEKDNLSSLSVVKIWADDGYEEKRPQFVTVSLFRDGVLYDQVILNKENNWRHTWENLNENSRWQLAEYQVPEHYKVETVRDNDVFVVTNTYQPLETLDDSVDINETNQVVTMINRLSWPGQLFLAVPVLAAIGLALFSLGYGIYRRWKDENKDANATGK
jgi:hypothetical protein